MNKKLKKGLTVSSAAAMGMSIVLPTVSVIAAPAVTNGWVNQNGTWYYYNNGTLVKNGWAKDSKGWAFLSAVDGSWVQEGWAKDSTGWGYIRNGYWVEHATYAKDANGWEFIGANGYWDSSVAPSATNPIDDATAAVVKAEGSKLAADVDAAKALVAKLNDAVPEKAALTTRLNAVVTNFEVASVTVVDALHVKVVFTQAVDEDTAEDAGNYSFDNEDDWVDEATVQEDGKSVILELKTGNALKNDSDDDYTVKITDVENKDGKVIDDYKEVLSLYDDVKPTVESVEMKDRDTLKITFSEFIKSKGDITIYDEDGDEISVSDSNITIEDDNTIEVAGLGGEDDGDYTVEIKNTKDYAGNKVETVTEDFTMEEDNSDPSVSSIKAISSTTLKITFDEAIDIDAGLSVVVTGPNTTYTLDENNATEVGGSDKKAYYVKVTTDDLDDGDSYKVVVDGYYDLAGNEGDSKTRYVKFDNEIGAELTSTEGVIKSYGGSKYAVFTFDQDVVDGTTSYVDYVNLDGSYEDEDGDTVDVTIDKDDVKTSINLDNLDDNQVAIKLSPYDKGDYTITFDDGFITSNDVESDSVDVTFSITTEEDDDVVTKNAYYENGYVYVVFSDEVDGDSALDESNYEIDGDSIFENAKFVSYTGHGYNISATDKQCVRLEIADDSDSYANGELSVKDIEDANGNDVEDKDITLGQIDSTTGPELQKATLNGIDSEDAITLTFDNAIWSKTAYSSVAGYVAHAGYNEVNEDDFKVVVDGSEIKVDHVTPSADGKTWTLTLRDDIDGDYDTVKAGTSADFDGEDENHNEGEADLMKTAKAATVVTPDTDSAAEIAAAYSKVETAEATPTTANVAAAQTAVNSLVSGSTLRTTLQGRLDVVKVSMAKTAVVNGTVSLSVNPATATAAEKTAAVQSYVNNLITNGVTATVTATATPGDYAVAYSLNGKTDSETITVTFAVPAVTVSGVTNGGVYKSIAANGITVANAASTTITYAGNTVAYTGQALTFEGAYVLTATGLDASTVTRNFTLDATAPVATVGTSTASDLVFTTDESSTLVITGGTWAGATKTSTAGTNHEVESLTAATSGQTVTFTVTDGAGNSKAYTATYTTAWAIN